jgi:hypothetical protein
MRIEADNVINWLLKRNQLEMLRHYSFIEYKVCFFEVSKLEWDKSIFYDFIKYD